MFVTQWNTKHNLLYQKISSNNRTLSLAEIIKLYDNSKCLENGLCLANIANISLSDLLYHGNNYYGDMFSD